MKNNISPVYSLYLTLSLFLFVALFFGGCSNKQAKIELQNFKVILAPPVSSGTAAYGTIKNTGSASDTLIRVESNAGKAMLHLSEIKSGMATMVAVEPYLLKPNTALVLKPMSYHLMLMDIDHQIIKEKGSVELSFIFEKSGKIVINVPVVSQ